MGYIPALNELHEMKLCIDDPVYFINNFIHINHPIHGPTLLKLSNKQEELVRSLHSDKRTIVLGNNYCGKNSAILAYYVWCCLFKYDQFIYIGTPTNLLAYEAMERFYYMYDSVPWNFKPQIRSRRRSSVEFDNGMKIIASSLNECSTRGYSLSRVFLYDFGTISNDRQESSWASVIPVIVNDSLVITSSEDIPNTVYSALWNGDMPMTRINMNEEGVWQK